MNKIILIIFILFLINLFLFYLIIFKINEIIGYFKKYDNMTEKMAMRIEQLGHMNEKSYTYLHKVFSCIYREDNEGNGMILYE